MPKINYPPGVPCWVETLQPDPRAALQFYAALFGWDATESGSMPDGGEYFVAQLHGDDVAGIATLPRSGIAEPAWTTYVSVDNLETTVERVRSAGGTIVVAPLDAHPAGRLAIVAAPTGATFGLWEPQERVGAQRINQPSAWAMSTLRTRNITAATPFYATIFGWNVETFDVGGASAALLRLPGYVGGLPEQPVSRDVVAVAISEPKLDAEHWAVDFWVADIDAAVARVAQHAGAIIRKPFDAAPFRRAVIADPAGVVCTINQLMLDRSE
ncbi:MAG: VOC family protein [Vulcanimicrobiaceae bacterium]